MKNMIKIVIFNSGLRGIGFTCKNALGKCNPRIPKRLRNRVSNNIFIEKCFEIKLLSSAFFVLKHISVHRSIFITILFENSSFLCQQASSRDTI